MNVENTDAPVDGYAVRCFYDEESRNWHFRAPELGISGGGDATLEEARQHALEAITFTLECQRAERDGRSMPALGSRDGA
jgi:predicted RNase H-like HicB family nuclease